MHILPDYSDLCTCDQAYWRYFFPFHRKAPAGRLVYPARPCGDPVSDPHRCSPGEPVPTGATPTLDQCHLSEVRPIRMVER